MEAVAMSRWTWWSGALVMLVLLLPMSASSQTISGTVTDTSGAVVPGVTVEAASPALIEQTRSVVTNEAGRYTIVNLRPGTYTVTFMLSGFTPMKHEGITLTSDFTAQVNAQLTVGNLAEVVTVGAASPVVDVQGVAKPTVYTRDMVDQLPTGRTPDAVMNTIPGVTPGFFGSQFRGTQDSLTMVDGMRATRLIGAGPSLTTASSSSNVYQEMSFSTAIDSAEMGQPGMKINLVPRDGGNQFRGSVFTNYTNDSMQTSNLNDDLRSKGLKDPPKQLKLVDFNPTFGGPIVRDRIWFQSTFQYTDTATQVLGSFFDTDPNPLRYVPSAQGGVNSSTAKNFTQRLTVQADQKDKFAGFFDWSDRNQPYFYSPLLFITPPPEATLALHSPNNPQIGVRWTRTHTSKLLFETSTLYARNYIFNDYRDAAAPWSGRYVDTPGLPPSGRTNDYAVLNLNTGSLLDLASVSDGNTSKSLEIRGTATYVTGSHSFRTGASFFSGSYHRPTAVVDNVVLRTFNGAPNSVVLTLPGNERENIDADWGVFAQDRWTHERLTVNAGLRLDLLQTSVPAQRLPASQWLGEQNYAPVDVLNYKDLSPRLGAAYDLFGNGKTAVKAALARFAAGETVNLTGSANPIRTIATTDTRAWTDSNGDGTIFNENGAVQFNELGASTNLNFGTAVPGTVFDPNVLGGWFNRGYSWETNLAVQHELLSRVGVSALYYHRILGNQRVNDNVAITPANYDGPFCVTAPSDPRLPAGGGQQICGLYDINPGSLGRVQNVNTFATNLGTGKGFNDVTTGYEFSVTARLPRGVFLQGGINLQNVVSDALRTPAVGGPTFNPCDVIDNPEVRFCRTASGYRPDLKLTGSYLLPLDVQVSAVYSGLAGPAMTATWNAPSASIAPALGRPLAAGATQTKAVQLIEPGAEYVPMRHIFDIRLAKVFRFDRYRVQGMVDLFNAFNNNSVTAVNTTFGPGWLLPTGIVSPRQVRIGAQFDF
jgi:hypothetical protein